MSVGEPLADACRLRGLLARREVSSSEVVRPLRAAGAILVGKTNLSELQIWALTASDTWGVTRNPWNAERSPGGTSGGSAVAVAAGMSAVAHGVDGGGSIRLPAAWCGLVGFKPAPDPAVLSRETWHGLAVHGPLARSVRDAALRTPTTGTDSARFAPSGVSRA